MRMFSVNISDSEVLLYINISILFRPYTVLYLKKADAEISMNGAQTNCMQWNGYSDNTYSNMVLILSPLMTRLEPADPTNVMLVVCWLCIIYVLM